jgi:hypothetical protein
MLHAGRTLFIQHLVGMIVLLCGVAMPAPSPSEAATAEDRTQFSVTAGLLTFATAPALPAFGPLELDGGAHTTNATMPPFVMTDATGSGSGWSLTVEAQTGTGRSAAFAQYCPQSKCGSDSEGYVSGGRSLPPGSLTFDSTGANVVAQLGTTGSAPTLGCETACPLDGRSAVTIASAADGAGMGTWLATGFGPRSLALRTPTTLRALPNEEVYRFDELWSFTSGP